ncbi:MAG: KTSC domain-containing protein [Azoarcus sp.]|nr:KTSC domain-containing protein [Azoarcus sp.]
MEMKPISSGKLSAIGYDAGTRTLRVELNDGSALDYSGVGAELWRRLSSSGSAWSYYRDNIEEEFTARRSSTKQDKKTNPLDDLFK